MTAPEPRRRPLPALALLLSLCVLAGLVWYHLLNRSGGPAAADLVPSCPATSGSPSISPPMSHPGGTAVLPAPGNVSLLVVNSTPVGGLAGRVRAAFEARGFTVTDATNDAREYGGHGVLKQVGEIRFRAPARQAARLTHFYLPKAQLRQLPGQGALVGSADVVVALGTKYTSLDSGAQVRRAVKAAGLRVAPPSEPSRRPPSC